MSVVSAAARRRWVVVVTGPALLLGALAAWPTVAPRVVGGVAEGRAGPAPGDLLDRALASRTVSHTALAESRGALGLPDLPRLGGVADLLGGTTRARVWWRSGDSWRVDVLTVTGERGTYGTATGTLTWDYERRERVNVLGGPGARLPRADDLLPPQAARRLLAGVGPSDRLESLPQSRIAGRRAVGLRVVPADPRSTIGRADVWLDAESGLPLRLRVVDRAGVDALVTQLTDVRLGDPPIAEVTPPEPVGVGDRVETSPDLAAEIDRYSPWLLPTDLAGAPGTATLLQGTATYGEGLVRFAVLPLPPRLAGDVLANARSAGAVDIPLAGGATSGTGSSGAGSRGAVTSGGVLVRVTSSLLNAVVLRADDGRHAYLIAGLVQVDLLERAARGLLADPPPPRTGR
jgi:hypothetical protein